MEKDQKIKLLKFNSEEQSNLVLFDAIKQQNSQRLFYLVKEQYYPVTPFVLNLMLDFGMEKQVPKLLELCCSYAPAVYDWLCVYWGRDKAEDFFCQNSFEDIAKNKVSTDVLNRNEMWSVLAEKKIMSNIPDDWLVEHPSLEAAKELLKRDLDKYAEWALKHEFDAALLGVWKGYKYLLKAGKYNYVMNYAEVLGLKIEEIEEILKASGNKYDFRNYEAKLLNAGLTDLSIQNLSKNQWLLCWYPKLVDWEKLWEKYDTPEDRKHLLRCASKNKKVTKEFLKKHKPKPWWRRRFGSGV